jgi:hypothetical protein
MAEEVLDEVLVKELHESGIDQVFVIKNLPKRLVYHKVPLMVQRYDRDGYTDGTMVPDPSGEKIDDLLDGLEYSQNGDESIVFPISRETARNALKAIDAYIAGTLPRDAVIPKRVAYPIDPTDSRSAPKPIKDLPVVELPVIQVAPVEVSPVAKAAPSRPTRNLTQQQRDAARERLAKARAVRLAKLRNEMNSPQA